MWASTQVLLCFVLGISFSRPYNMQEFSISRYGRKVPLYHRTSEVKQDHYHQKSSSDNQYTSFRLSRLLPKITTQHRHLKSISPELEKQQEREKADSFYSKQAKTLLNLTKISFKQTVSQKQHYRSRYSVVTKQGKRPYNEDRYLCLSKLQSPYPQFYQNKDSFALYAVFDGHGGSQCAQFLKQNFSLLLSRSKVLEVNPQQALKQTFSKIQQKFLALCEAREPIQTSGSCAVVCLVGKEKVHVANLGDSRAILLSAESFLALTQDHKPHDQGEKLRILKNGGKIYRDHQQNQSSFKIFKQMRISPGNLNVSRTLGDAQVKLKKYGGLPGMISSVPDVSSFELGAYKTLLLATDGLFEAFTNQEIHSRFVSSQEEPNSNSSGFIDQLCEEAEKRSTDNITVVLVEFY